MQHSITLLPLEDPIQPLYEDIPRTVNQNSIKNCSTVERLENSCECFNSTKISSFLVEKDLETVNCKCKSESIEETHLDIKTVKERHISIDSARDSGIGENSNFADKYDDTSDEDPGEKSSNSFDLDLQNSASSSSGNCIKQSHSERFSDLRGYWQPKLKKSLADRLPDNSFYLISPSRYIFPGAEVFDEKLEEDLSFSDNSDIELDIVCNNISV